MKGVDVDALIAADARLVSLERVVAGRLDDDPAHDLAHARRVAAWTVRLGEAEGGVDRTLAVAAALLHDVVNVPKDSPERASASARSAAFAREVMAELRFPRADAELVADAVEDHSFSRGAVPRSALGRALQDADRLEALGAIGLCRTIGTGQRMGGRYFDPLDPWAEARPLDDRRYSVDHFFRKLLLLPDTMQTAAGREEARHRARLLEVFLDALAHELDRPRPRG